MIRAMIVSGVRHKDASDMLLADGHDPCEVLAAAAAEGLGLLEFLEGCIALANGQGGEVEAARICAMASIHPGSLALVVKDLTKARWLAELYSDSHDLAAGVMGDGSLRLPPIPSWDLPEGLAVPGLIKVPDIQCPARWPERLRVSGGITSPRESLSQRATQRNGK